VSRRKARVLAFQSLYYYEAAKPELIDLLRFEWEAEKVARMDEGALAFARILVAGTIENLSVIDERIKAHLVHWEITRIKKVDLALLRISVYSLLFQKEIPQSVIIEEAIAISREYGEEGAFRFINGILDNIKKTID
jgi:N utilization substance protein B